MMTKLVKIADSNKFIAIFIRIFVFLATKIISAFDEMTGWIRIKFSIPDKYSQLKEYKDKYKGKRCFIVCTGPSLTIDDVEKLKNEYTFGMNSLCLLCDKTSFRPTFYSCIDVIVYRKFKSQIEEFTSGSKDVFISNRIARNERVNPDWKIIPINVAYHTYDRWFRHKYWCKFSDNSLRTIYDMYSVTHALIQLATYMGFSKIYLLGADCTFRKNQNTHFIEYGTLDQDFDSAEERCVVGYDAIKEYMDSHDVSLYNATRGGNLEKFERVDLDQVLMER